MISDDHEPFIDPNQLELFRDGLFDEEAAIRPPIVVPGHSPSKYEAVCPFCERASFYEWTKEAALQQLKAHIEVGHVDPWRASRVKSGFGPGQPPAGLKLHNFAIHLIMLKQTGMIEGDDSQFDSAAKRAGLDNYLIDKARYYDSEGKLEELIIVPKL